MRSCSLALLLWFLIFLDRYLLLIGAYRDNEVSQDHPLKSLIKDLEDHRVSITDLEVQPLNTDHITNLLIDTLGVPDKVAPLAELLHNKTLGNPFFVNQLLKSFYQKQHITFNFESMQWEWDLQKIVEDISITDNVVDLMIQLIQTCSLRSQNLLKLAAAVGNKFTLDVLATIAGNLI